MGEGEEGILNIPQAIMLISSLISLSHSVRVFASKWQLIRNKFEELHSSLVAAENCDFGDNPSLSGLTPAIITTVNDCHNLAHRCVDLSYSGKLLMQSDLDDTLKSEREREGVVFLLYMGTT